MGCSGCSTGVGVPKGCGSNGNCGTSGCDKLEVFDWLANMELPSGQEKFNWVEVRFKNGRKEYFKNINGLTLTMSSMVAVESSPGHDIGIVSLTGELVKAQMSRRKQDPNSETFKKVYRVATQRDIDKWREVQAKETETMFKSREIAQRLDLKMKISDVEYQGDGAKAIFYYTAEERVDFRQLIKDLASSFSMRVEMRQIGTRQEAGRLGGIGSCGRELCCTTWLTDFRSVNTSAARYQQLSLNPSKLAGQCGKLKCCLNFELDSYLDSLKAFPNTDTILYTKKGNARFIKMDIFKQIMWYAYMDQPSSWIELKVERVQEIIEFNKDKEKNNPESLEFVAEKDNRVLEIAPAYENVVGQDSITRFDQKKQNQRRKKRNPNQRNPKAKADGNQRATVERTQQKPRPKPNRRPAAAAKDKEAGGSAGNGGEGAKKRSNNNKRRNYRRGKKGPEDK
jgi:cell fate regulator YaaT (PSP1 superfamily)